MANRRRSLPPVSPKIAAELRPLVAAISEIIEVGEGVRGDPLDRKLTLRDLLDSGIGKLNGRAAGGGSLSPGQGAGTPNLAIPPKPTDFNAVGGFNGAINLTWAFPGTLYSNHAYTNIYRSETDNFANAILAGREDGGFYTDYRRDDVSPTPYYYWITFTSTSDIEGPTNATAGTLAQALFDPDYIIGLLEGLLSESELAADLLSPIQSIPSIQDTLDALGIKVPDIEDIVLAHGVQIPTMQDLLDDFGPRIAQNENEIVVQDNQVIALQSSIESLDLDVIANADAFSSLDTRVVATETEISSQSGELTAIRASINDLSISPFDADQNYAIGELLRYDSEIYQVIATQSQPNVTPPNATYYDPQPDYESLGAAVSANSAAAAALQTRVTAAEGSITSQATDTILLQSDVSDAQADIVVNANAASSLGTRVTTAEGKITTATGDITSLNSRVTDTEGKTLTNTSAVSSLQTRVTTAESTIIAQASDLTALDSTLTDAQTDITTNANANSALTTRVSNAEGQLTTESNRVTTLTNSLINTDGNVLANSNATTALQGRVTLAEGNITSQSSSLTSLQNTLTSTTGKANANTQGLSLLTTRVGQTESGLTAQSSRVDQVEADIQALDVDGNAAALNSLTARVDQTEDDITAQGVLVGQVQSNIGTVSSAVQTKAESSVVSTLQGEVTSVKARYSIKLDVNGRMSGLIFGDNGTQSSLVIAANAMYFIDPGQSITPFNPATDYSSMDAARDTQLVFGYAKVEGMNRFVINAPAYIPEGYITSGQVGAIGFGKIQAADGTPVTTVQGKLKADYIDVDNLRVAVAATFDGTAQSGNYSPGVSGWRILQSGNVEFNNLLARGNIDGSVITGSVVRGSVIEGGAFVAVTEYGSPYVGIISNMSWSRSGGLGGSGGYLPVSDIYSGNYSDTDQFRRYRRAQIDIDVTFTVTSNINRFSDTSSRLILYNGGVAVIDTGSNNSGAYTTCTISTRGFTECEFTCGDDVCRTYYVNNQYVYRIRNYPYSGDGLLQARLINAVSGSYSISTTAINDY
jgi:predicted  nucleic acid-binding Zn-ribbon protein